MDNIQANSLYSFQDVCQTNAFQMYFTMSDGSPSAISVKFILVIIHLNLFPMCFELAIRW